MKRRTTLIFLICLLTGINIFAQSEPEISLNLLANDKIADVNVDYDKFVKSFGEAVRLMKKEFYGISRDQKIALLIVSHKNEKPTVQLYAKPSLDVIREKSFVDQINAIKFENTKLVDFPILITTNVTVDDVNSVFDGIISPVEKSRKEYEAASLKKKVELNKAWAANEVLPVLSAYQTIVDDKFLGIKNFGNLISKKNFSETQYTSNLTDNNSDYWRACMEMSSGNELIPATKIFMYISQGEFDYAKKYLEIVRTFSDKTSITNKYLEELSWRLDLFYKQLNTEIEKGIVENDKGNYENAIAIYSNILNNYPNSAWALYEQYFTQNTLGIKNKEIKLDDRRNWDKAKINIFKSDPLYKMDVWASTGKESYLIFRRNEIAGLFKNNDEYLNDIYKYADISMDLGIYDFAAQLFWYSFTYNKVNSSKSLNKFLYCIDKLGVTELKQAFEGNFEKEFKKIDTEKEKEMKGSDSFKVIKK